MHACLFPFISVPSPHLPNTSTNTNTTPNNIHDMIPSISAKQANSQTPLPPKAQVYDSVKRKKEKRHANG